MLDLVASQIDKLQLVASSKSPNTPVPLTEAEHALVSSRYADLISALPPPPPTSASSTDPRDAELLSHIRRLVEDVVRAESSSKEYRERLERASKQRERLESLSKELQQRNRRLVDDLHALTAAHDKANAEMREKFDSTLTSVQATLTAHSAEREQHAAQQAALREHVDKLTAYDAARTAAHEHALKTKELEHRLVSTQLAQSAATVELRDREIAALKANAEARSERERVLEAQLSAYGERMASVEERMTGSAAFMEEVKGETDKLRRRVQKEHSGRLAAEEKVRESTGLLLASMEERKAEQVDLLRVKRQKDALQQLCQTLERDRKKEKDRAKGVVDSVEVKAEEGKAQLSAEAPDSAVS